MLLNAPTVLHLRCIQKLRCKSKVHQEKVLILLARSAYFALLCFVVCSEAAITEKALNLLTNLLTSTNLRFVRRFVLVLVVADTNRRFVRSCKAKFTRICKKRYAQSSPRFRFILIWFVLALVKVCIKRQKSVLLKVKKSILLKSSLILKKKNITFYFHLDKGLKT